MKTFMELIEKITKEDKSESSKESVDKQIKKFVD